MKESGFEFAQNCCGACGAGEHNNYQHAGDCSIELSHVSLLPYWCQGWNDSLRGVRGNSPGLRSPERRAYDMGYACGLRMQAKSSLPLSRKSALRWQTAT